MHYCTLSFTTQTGWCRDAECCLLCLPVRAALSVSASFPRLPTLVFPARSESSVPPLQLSILTNAWHSLLPQTHPLVCIRLLCGHVHQWFAGGQAGRGEDGGSRPWCVVGLSAVCIHGYAHMYCIITTAEEVMFSSTFVCLLVSRITQNRLIRFPWNFVEEEGMHCPSIPIVS